MSLVWPYILSGVLTAIACVGVQSAVGGQQAVAAVAPQAVPVPTQWQQQNVTVIENGAAYKSLVEIIRQQDADEWEPIIEARDELR